MTKEDVITKKDIHKFLKEIGIKKNDTVLIHTSMRAIGETEGGCDGVIDAFCSYLSDGLFLVPSHTWENVNPENPVYDVRKTIPCIGALPTVAAFRKDGVRSLHPTHSVTAFGKRAAEFVEIEKNSQTPCSPDGAWAKLADENASILLIGVGLSSCTFIHAIDEMLELPDRISEPFIIKVTDYDGNEEERKMSQHMRTGSANYENYRKALEHHGALKNAKLGNAEVSICYAKEMCKTIKMLWSKADYNLCEQRKEIPEKYYVL